MENSNETGKTTCFKTGKHTKSTNANWCEPLQYSDEETLQEIETDKNELQTIKECQNRNKTEEDNNANIKKKPTDKN